ncbi:MAG: glucose-6-phosphate dehydrogenase, partial [Vicinamibacterales bacterium]
MIPADNPLLDNLRIEPTPGATTLVIFGASGDLTKRKLLPALHSLSRGQRLPARFAVVGIGRTELTDDRFRQQFRESLQEFTKTSGATDEVARSLQERMFYLAGEIDDAGLYSRLSKRLHEIDGGEGVLYYLAIPPSVYGT